MLLYRVTVRMNSKTSTIGYVRYEGIFRHSMDAVLSALRDWPEARCISAECLDLKGGAA
jgi:hypothetical protein